MHRRLLLTALTALGVGVGGAGVLLAGDRVEHAPAVVALALVIGWSFIGVGLFAWRQRPEARVGLLLCAVGFAWFASGLVLAEPSAVYTAGLTLSALVYAVLAHLLLAFPTGRLESAGDRRVVAAGYVVAVLGQLVVLPFYAPPAGDGRDNLLLVRRDDTLADALTIGVEVVAVAVLLIVAGRVVRRWRRSRGAQRAALAPVLAAGALVLALVALFLALRSGAALLAALAALAVVPFAFLAGLARTRFFRAGAVEALLTRLGAERPTDGVRTAVAEALGDPTVQVAFWLPDRRRFGDASGQPVRLPAADDPARAVTEVARDGAPIAALIHDSALLAEPELLRAVGHAAALALENERLAAELRARVRELEASREQLILTGEAERRGLERDLHDGAQARLVALRLRLGLARRRLHGDPEGTRIVDDARAELDDALAELRALARGLHPALLGTRGLASALRDLAARSPVPVRLSALPDEPLPAPVESAAYFVVAESLTNVAKHAPTATQAIIHVERRDGTLLVGIEDDGPGGADPHGSGLHGLAARVAALDGSLEVTPGERGGTVVRAVIPVSA